MDRSLWVALTDSWQRSELREAMGLLEPELAGEPRDPELRQVAESYQAAAERGGGGDPCGWRDAGRSF